MRVVFVKVLHSLPMFEIPCEYDVNEVDLISTLTVKISNDVTLSVFLWFSFLAAFVTKTKMWLSPERLHQLLLFCREAREGCLYLIMQNNLGSKPSYWPSLWWLNRSTQSTSWTIRILVHERGRRGNSQSPLCRMSKWNDSKDKVKQRVLCHRLLHKLK